VDRKPFRILAIAGSLRQGSYNRGLLRAAEALSPDGMEVRFFDIGQLPFFNEDVEAVGDPEPVHRFKDAIATPEYNGAVPGVLANAIDWASRPTGRSVLRNKPVAVMGAVLRLWRRRRQPRKESSGRCMTISSIINILLRTRT
jgi:chromate reductase